MKKIGYIIICFFVLMSCSKDNGEEVQTLANYLSGKTIETGAVVACAASDKNTGDILTFYYPEFGASNIRFYKTNTTEVDENNYQNYTRNLLSSEPVFNGHLGKFTQKASNEKWIIVTFELDGEVKISNPIQSKQISKSTVWNDEVVVNQSESGMPSFIWEDNPVGDNAIYFQVVSDENDNLLSGTYTYENQFQYYNLNNVVLNVTTNAPPDLILNENYNFTLMDVSLDNWVNWVIQKPFIAE
ncbi:hypothetical protein [uncultured Algibacter sp.]|uniref:hypothetical protein n=1 Tax=uncultured Algibacter sp. TaxID=298659 RepID=UPI0026342CAD|nr:hypothetical protein [uncultured Algibacter sp.]